MTFQNKEIIQICIEALGENDLILNNLINNIPRNSSTLEINECLDLMSVAIKKIDTQITDLSNDDQTKILLNSLKILISEIQKNISDTYQEQLQPTDTESLLNEVILRNHKTFQALLSLLD